MSLKPLNKRILVELSSPETVTKAGIIIPEKAKVNEGRANRGVVIDIADDVVSIKKGDFLYFNKYTGAEIEHDGYKYLIVKQEDIYAVVK